LFFLATHSNDFNLSGTSGCQLTGDLMAFKFFLFNACKKVVILRVFRGNNGCKAALSLVSIFKY